MKHIKTQNKQTFKCSHCHKQHSSPYLAYNGISRELPLILAGRHDGTAVICHNCFYKVEIITPCRLSFDITKLPF